MNLTSNTTEKNFNNVFSKHINSSMIADILGGGACCPNTITGYNLNLIHKRIFGKISTLKIRKLKDGEDPDGIYDALQSYKHIDDGDVIIVETEVPDRAYFGELNANIALRSGAIGTIVAGKTRDIECVNTLDYPVFSKGYSSADVKGYGTLDSINEKINLDGVEINPGDYVFADINGIVIIPADKVKQTVDEAIASFEKEMNVKKNVLLNLEAENIPKITGNF